MDYFLDIPCNDTYYICDHDYEDEALHTPLINNEESAILNQVFHAANIIILCITGISFCTNGTVLVIYCMMERVSRKIPNFMLFNQAIVDTMICIYACLGTLPSYIKLLTLKTYYGITTIVLGHYTVFLALGILVLTSGERFLALKRPFFHRRYVSKNKMLISILILYTIAFIPCVIYIGHLNKFGEIDVMSFPVVYAGTRLSVVFAGIIVVLVVLFLTLRTAQISMRHRTVRSSIAFNKAHDKRKERFFLSERRKEMKMIAIFITMAAVFIISYLPMAVINTIKLATASIALFDLYIIEIIGYVLYISSAFVNPFLTLGLKDDFKRHIFKCFQKKKNENSEPRTELLSTSVM